MNIENIKKAFEIISGAQSRRDQENQEFLKLYHMMVVNSTPHVVKEFGAIPMPVVRGADFKLELTAQDYLWWEQQIKAGRIIEGGISAARARIFSRLANLSNAAEMTPLEKAAFIALFSDNTSEAK